MSLYLFISDLHLCDSRPATVDLFLRFLRNEAAKAKNLYILGDLFDAWVGDDDDSQTAKQVIKGIKQLTERGTDVFIMHGNRDFLIGEDFCRACHASLLADPTVIEVGSQPVLLTHGDQLCTRDVAYQQARLMRTQQQWLDQFAQKSLSERKAIAAEYRKKSGENKSLLADDIMDVTPGEVENWFKKYQSVMMIHGHTHRPAVHQHLINGTSKPRIVLSDWHEKHATAIAVDEKLNLEQLAIS